MLTNVSEVKKNVLEKRLAALSEEYIAVNGQLERNRNDSDFLRLEREAKVLFQRMEELHLELEELEATNSSSNQNYLNLQEKLSKIDFIEAMSIVESTMSQFGREGGAALFLIQNSYSMAGKLCISEIRERLVSGTSDFKHYPVELTPEGKLDEVGILERIARYVNVESILDKERYAQAIIGKICQSLQSGSVFFLELRKWDELSCQEQILPWFIDNFWTPLVCQLPTITTTYRKVKFIVILVSDTELSSDCLALPYYCKRGEFDPLKIINLPLNAWTQKDIEDWLDSYSGLPAYRIDSMAKKIYRASLKGIPTLVYNALLEEFK
jgi:hypothetical protein